MKNTKKHLVIIHAALAFSLCAGLCGCDPRFFYNDGYPDLCTEAANSLFDVFMPTAKCYPVEEDSHGRTLFVFTDTSAIVNERMYGGEYIVALLVCQRSIDGIVYYYPDYNFIFKKWTGKYTPIDYGIDTNGLVKDAIDQFSFDEIDGLKTVNDWGTPVDFSSCVSQVIVNRNPYGSGDNMRWEFRRMLYNKLGPSSVQQDVSFFRHFAVDDYGRDIYFCRVADEEGVYTSSYVVLIRPDETYTIMEIRDLMNYQPELKLFKYRNDWNQPLTA